MTWGRELSDDDEPLFGDRPARPVRAAAPGPRLALPLPDAYAS